MNSLFSLPFSLFSHIRDFVVLPSIDETQDERNQAFQDWRNFCNCSNHQVLQEIKARFSFYNLNLRLSFNYLRYCLNKDVDGESSSIICNIMSNISNPKFQIFLNFDNGVDESNYEFPMADAELYFIINSKVYGINIIGGVDNLLSLDLVEDVSFLSARCDWFYDEPPVVAPSSSDKLVKINRLGVTCSGLTHVALPAFGKVEQLCLEYAMITDVTALRNIRKLSLLSCENLVDISPLRNVFDLNLTDCENIVDVSSLGNVHKLNLSGCKLIIDVTALSKVYDLNIDFCKRVKNISALDHVSRLSVIGCRGGKLPHGLTSNNSSHRLKIPLDEISLNLIKSFKDNKKQIILDGSAYSRLSGMKEIMNSAWHLKLNLSEFVSQCEDLSFSCNGYERRFYSLHSLRKLYLKFTPLIKLFDLPVLQELYIDFGKANRSTVLHYFLSPLPQLKYLTVRNVSFPKKMFVLVELPSLKEVTIDDPEELIAVAVNNIILSKLVIKTRPPFSETPLLIDITKNGSIDIVSVTGRKYLIFREETSNPSSK
jgi:hypothetical protein